MNALRPAPLLKLALIADAMVSASVAVLQVAIPGFLAGLTALPAALLSGTGVFLLGYTGLLTFMARSATLPVPLVWLIVIGNIFWAVGCAAIWATGQVAPSNLGGAYLVVQAAAVLVFAALQAAGLRKSLADNRLAVAHA